MLPNVERRIAWAGVGAAFLLLAVFAGLVVGYGRDLRAEIQRKMIERDAAVLYPITQQQIESDAVDGPAGPSAGSLLAALLPSARREGLLAMAIFDGDGVTLDRVPSTQPLVELPIDDYIRLQHTRWIARFSPAFALDQLVPGTAPAARGPVLEVILPLHRRIANAAPAENPAPIGFVRYHLDARNLAAELAALDRTVRRQTTTTLALGLTSIAAIFSAAWFGLRRAQRIIAERNQRLQRTNFELSLAAKASALGQIASHLIHGLQGPVAGLRAMVASRERTPVGAADWATAADYTERMQALIHETVALLGDTSAQASYDLSGVELAEIIQRRNLPSAQQAQVSLKVCGGFDATLDSHRGGLLCLIVNNLVQNALEASETGETVTVTLALRDGIVTAVVEDRGGGIPAAVQAHLFVPGRSGRPEGTGLGLAISQLLARQIGATLTLESTGVEGTTFKVALPLAK